MFCPGCGQPILSQANFCSACGKPITAVSSEPVASRVDPYQPPKSKRHHAENVYAGFWRRLGAYLIDWIILFAAMVAIGAAAGGYGDGGDAKLAINLFAWIGSWLYFALMENSAWQATLGKRVIGIRVCNAAGERISFGRAAGRYFGKIISGMMLGVGFLMVAFTARKQGLHDLMANCLVVDKTAEPADIQQVPASGMSVGAIIAIALLAAILPIGILAAIAIPAYQDYVTKSKMMEALHSLAPAKTAMAEYYLSHGQIPPGFDLAKDAGYSATSPYLSSIRVRDQDSAIEATANVAPFQGKVLLVVPVISGNGVSDWKCGSVDIPAKYLPSNCQNRFQ